MADVPMIAKFTVIRFNHLTMALAILGIFLCFSFSALDFAYAGILTIEARRSPTANFPRGDTAGRKTFHRLWITPPRHASSISWERALVVLHFVYANVIVLRYNELIIKYFDKTLNTMQILQDTAS